jgi:hypothetical protein
MTTKTLILSEAAARAGVNVHDLLAAGAAGDLAVFWCPPDDVGTPLAQDVRYVDGRPLYRVLNRVLARILHHRRAPAVVVSACLKDGSEKEVQVRSLLAMAKGEPLTMTTDGMFVLTDDLERAGLLADPDQGIARLCDCLLSLVIKDEDHWNGLSMESLASLLSKEIKRSDGTPPPGLSASTLRQTVLPALRKALRR